MADYMDGISYLRTTRENLPILYPSDETFSIGGCKVLKKSQNDNLCIIAAGITLHEALSAHAQLAALGINASVIDLYSVKPIDTQTIARVAAESGNIILTVEDHYLEGGLGEAVRAALPSKTFTFKHLTVQDISRSGKPHELLALAGINAASIVTAARELVKKV
jgi:transketolase